MATILVTGSNGQLGSEIKALSKSSKHVFYFTDVDTLDITQFDRVLDFIEKHDIQVILNCAAYTAVDRAEENESMANAINHLAVANMVQIAKDKKIQLIHVSTDYIFDGTNFTPYVEEDVPNPKNTYGKTKLLGEQALLVSQLPDSFILRTSWVYSSFGANFVKTMLRLGKEKESLAVISDQVGTPTYAKDLASVMLFLIGKQTSEPEVLHYSNEGVCSWYDFAQAIFEIKKLNVQLRAIPTEAFPTLAQRPKYSILGKEKIKERYALAIPYWRTSLQRCLDNIA